MSYDAAILHWPVLRCNSGELGARYDVRRMLDGQRFLTVKPHTETTGVVVALKWFDRS